MSKWTFNKLLHLNLSTLVGFALFVFAVVQFFTFYGHYNYSHITHDELENHLYKAINPNLLLKKDKPRCRYRDILYSTNAVNSWEIPNDFSDFSANGLINGSYVPEECNPLYSVAILVTYRNRQKQLDVFLPYMHNFLRKQNIHYRIYLIEQQDKKPWNKGALYNIGAKQAIADKFPCLVLQDVDLLPLHGSNLYVCMNQPRHISASIDKFRFVLPYTFLVGGVMAIRADHYTLVNGFSNKFEGWGGEDDDFSSRLAAHKLNVIRFPREMSTYTMLLHRQEPKNVNRLQIMKENNMGVAHDGLDTVKFESVLVKNHRLFTLIGVKL